MRNTIFYLILILMGLSMGCSTSKYYHLETIEFNDLDYGFPVKTLQIRNINIAFIDEGSAPEVLLLIHGLGSNAKAWNQNITTWKNEYRVIAVDLPGYFKSDKGDFDYSMEFYAQVLTELLTKLSIKKATFIGHSMGGQIAMTIALKYPERVDKLVLISTAGFEKFTEGEGDWLRNAVTPEFVEDTSIRNISINLNSNFYKMPDEASFMITDRIAVRKAKGFKDYCYAVFRNVGAMLDGVVYDKLGEIQQPTLIIFGENDQLIPNPYLHGGWTTDVAAIGAEKIPNSELLLIPECGHFAQFEKAGEVNAAVLSFMKK